MEQREAAISRGNIWVVVGVGIQRGLGNSVWVVVWVGIEEASGSSVWGSTIWLGIQDRRMVCSCVGSNEQVYEVIAVLVCVAVILNAPLSKGLNSVFFRPCLQLHKFLKEVLVSEKCFISYTILVEGQLCSYSISS